MKRAMLLALAVTWASGLVVSPGCFYTGVDDEPDAAVDAAADASTDTDVDTDADTDTGTSTDTDTGSDSDSDTDTDTYTGPDADSDTDTDADSDTCIDTETCTSGAWEGNHYITEDEHIEAISGYTEITGDLTISDALLSELTGLECLTTVGGDLWVYDTCCITSLSGLCGITSVGGDLVAYANVTLPDCEVCDLLEQITSGPSSIDVHDNLDDSCTPVPANCP